MSTDTMIVNNHWRNSLTMLLPLMLLHGWKLKRRSELAQTVLLLLALKVLVVPGGSN